jgi:hypothetical protein
VFARDSYGKAARERSPLRVFGGHPPRSRLPRPRFGQNSHRKGISLTNPLPRRGRTTWGERRLSPAGGGSMRLRSGPRRGVAQHDHVAGGMVHDEACRVAQGLLPRVPRRVSCFAGEVGTKGLLEGRGGGDSRRGHARGLGHPGIPLRRVPSQRGFEGERYLADREQPRDDKKKCLKEVPENAPHLYYSPYLLCKQSLGG